MMTLTNDGPKCSKCGDWIEIHDGQPVCKSGCDDREPCFDCGHTVEWSENARDWLHIGENLGCFMDHRNTVLSKQQPQTNEGGAK